MSVIVYDPLKFVVPAGTYTVRFLGTKDREPFSQPRRDGKPLSNEPRLSWQFQVLGPPGESIGKIIDQGTGTNPGKKSKLLYVLNLFLGRMPEPYEQFDPAKYVGKVYELVWGANPASDEGGLHIAFLREVSAAPPPSNGTARYWLEERPGASIIEIGSANLQALVDRTDDPSVMGVMAYDQAGGWRKAADFGFVKRPVALPPPPPRATGSPPPPPPRQAPAPVMRGPNEAPAAIVPSTEHSGAKLVPAGAQDSLRAFFVQTPTGPVAMAQFDVRTRMGREGLRPEALLVCPTDDEAGGYRPASAFGLVPYPEQDIPF